MDAAASWQAFACTGNILRYLDYKQRVQLPEDIRQEKRTMEPFVTLGLVLKETRYKESDRILTILTPELGVISAMAAEQPAAEKQAVQRLRAVLLFRVYAGARTQYVYRARSGGAQHLSRHFLLH